MFSGKITIQEMTQEKIAIIFRKKGRIMCRLHYMESLLTPPKEGEDYWEPKLGGMLCMIRSMPPFPLEHSSVFNKSIVLALRSIALHDTEHSSKSRLYSEYS